MLAAVGVAVTLEERAARKRLVACRTTGARSEPRQQSKIAIKIAIESQFDPNNGGTYVKQSGCHFLASTVMMRSMMGLSHLAQRGQNMPL